jgi:peptidoglycan LD-endopeptidase LytH
MQLSKYYIYIIFCAITTVGCSGKTTLDHLFEKASPYEKYKRSLADTQLDQTALGEDWIEAGEVTLDDSLVILLPYTETGYFSPEKPSALCLRYKALEGQNIYITLQPLSHPDAIFFIDIFETKSDSSLQLIQSADTIHSFAYEVERSGWHALRIQPELLRGGPYELNISFQPSLSFPVSGKTSKAVGSFFGDPRDGGKRPHKGIDIFAPKGTPVLAASEGRVSRVTTNRLGGKVIWLTSIKNRFTQYYAHLDSQAVQPGQKVQVGDTIGFVGNTGNARTTPPHLHFSIYKYGSGAVDPYPFVHALLEEAPPAEIDTSHIGMPARTKATLSNVRQAPTTTSPILDTYPQHTLLNIEGKSNKWYRITLPNAQRGYLHESLVESVENPTREIDLKENDTFYYDINGQAIKGGWMAGTSQVLGAFDSLLYVKTAQGYYGWVVDNRK